MDKRRKRGSAAALQPLGGAGGRRRDEEKGTPFEKKHAVFIASPYDTKPVSLDDQGKIRKGDAALYYRRASVEWLQLKAADTSFQPTGEDDLVYQVCYHLVETIPQSMFEGEESLNSYTLPGRYHQLIFKRCVLWGYFQSVRDLKKEGGGESAAPPRSFSDDGRAGDGDGCSPPASPRAADAGAGRGGHAAPASEAASWCRCQQRGVLLQ